MSNLKSVPRIFFLLGFVVCLYIHAGAQSATATLSGTVEDTNGAVVPGANVTIENVATRLRRQVTTNESGSFTVPLLPPSEYTVTVESKGFAPVQINKVVLNVGDQKSLTIALKAGNISEMVQITADAPLINESPAVATTVDRQFVTNLPLNGRSFQSLISLTPGVVVAKVPANFAPGQFSVNGQRTDTNYFTVDGVSANFGINSGSANAEGFSGAQPSLAATGGTNNLVSVEALQEFRVQTSSFAPEFGRSPGAQVEILTRSGTNQFHGTLFDYFRNDALDANDWFANATRQRKPPLRQNDFGGVFGGPVLLPRFGEGGRQPGYNGRNRTFFFFSYEGLRLRQPQVAISSVPSLLTRRNAAATVQPYLNAFPIPNGPDLVNPVTGQPTGFAQFFASYADSITLNAASIRIDHTISRKLNLFGRYNKAPSSSTSHLLSSPNNLISNDSDTTTLTLGATLSLSASTINELRANFSRGSGASVSRLTDFGGAVVPPDSLLFPSFTSSGLAIATVGLSYNSSSPLYAVGQSSSNLQRQLNVVDTLSFVRGAHQFKFGFDYRRLSPIVFAQEYRLNLTFTNASDAPAGKVGSVVTRSNEMVRPVYTNLSVFAQDAWKASRRLTLTYGLRWELNPPPHEADGKEALTLTGLDNPATYALAPRGTPLYQTTYGNFAPRFGLAYQLSLRSGRETLVRGGIGLFYDLGSNEVGIGYSNFPFTATVIQSNLLLPLTAAQVAKPAFPTNFNPPFSSAFSVYESNFKLPYTLQWNLAVSQSLGSNQTITATYVAALGRRLLHREVRPQPNPSFASTVAIYRNDSGSDYQALQLQFNRRLSKGLQVLASYTWSHAIDDISDGVFSFSPERGASDFDVRHSFSAATTYNIPYPTAPALVGPILRGWAVDVVIHAQSAPPIDLIARSSVTIDNIRENARPDLNPGVPLYIKDDHAPGGRRFNPAAFAVPLVGRRGTLGRNVLRGFPLNQVDLALRRRFSLGERLKLQLRAEAFNLFNHPNFGAPNNSLTSGTFGLATSMLGRSLGGLNPLYQIGGSRSIQIALKLDF